MKQATPTPRALSSPLLALAEVEDAAARRIEAERLRWPDDLSARVMQLVQGNHENNRDLLERLAEQDGAVTPVHDARAAKLAEVLLRGRALARVDNFELAHLEQLERDLERAYEIELDPAAEHVSSHAKQLLREGPLARARQNIRVVRLMPHRRHATVDREDGRGVESEEPGMAAGSG